MTPTISIASYSFHGLLNKKAMSVFQYFETVKYRYGMTTADIWNGMLAEYGEEYLKFVRQMMDEHGLSLENLCCDGCHLWAAEAEEQKKLDQAADDCFRAAEILGAKTIRMDVGVRDKVMSTEQLDFIARKYEAYCERAANIGAKLGPENHWGASTNVVELRKLFAAVSAKNFGLLLHLGNWRESENQSEAAIIANDAEFAPRAMHTHLSFEVCEKAEKRVLPLLECGYAGSYSIESHKSTNEYNNVAYQLAHVRRVIAGLAY